MSEPPERRSILLLRPELRQILVLALDGAIAFGCFWLATFLRFEGAIPEGYRTTLPWFALILACVRMLVNLAFRLHRWSFRFSGLADGARIAMAGAFGTGGFLAILFLLRNPGPPRSVVVLELLLSTLLMATARFSPRLAGLYLGVWNRSRRDGTLRTLIVGAGSAGEMLLRDLQRSGEHSYRVVGFVDDDPGRRHHVVSGQPVLGAIPDLPRIVRETRAEQVLIAIPRLAGRRIREILSLCADLKLRFKILPVSFLYFQDRGAGAAMQDLVPDDLLPREPVVFADALAPARMAGRTALVTGAAGSIGSEIAEQLLRAGIGRIVLVDMNENGLYLGQRSLARRYPRAWIDVEVADMRDPGRLHALFERTRPHDVFHAAAHKHVPLMEAAPCEAVKNNVAGTRNVAAAADAVQAQRFVYISTDKAVRPASVMGATKRIGEEIVRSFNGRSETRFTAVRFGNVLGSAGSVVPLFREQIACGGPVTVTDPEVRRYFMTITEAVALVLTAGYGDYGELCVLDMGEQIKIVDLARHMITMAGHVPDVDVAIEYTGLRPGEKLSEELLTEEEERSRRVHDKIFVADCPAPRADLDARLAELIAVAREERDDRVLELLGELVPTYGRAQVDLPDTRTA